jgi:BMFP domain-containing protein YqiC
MQTRNPFFDDLAKTMESAMGLAQAAGEEARAAFRAQGDRLAAEFDLVRRDELDAVRDALTAQIVELRAEIARLKPAEPTSPGASPEAGPGAVAVD